MSDPGAMEGPGLIIGFIVAAVVLLMILILGLATWLFVPWRNDRNNS